MAWPEGGFEETKSYFSIFLYPRPDSRAVLPCSTPITKVMKLSDRLYVV